MAQFTQDQDPDSQRQYVHEDKMQVAAAKLHVLDLAPIKEKLGDRWPRLAGLVQKLFESTIRKAQGPRDHFVRDGELSYVATFHGFSPEETSLACLAIAQEVCALLFGQDVVPVSVRSLVGQVSEPLSVLVGPAVGQVAAELERCGIEHVVRKQLNPISQQSGVSDGDAILRAQRYAGTIGYKFALVPVWDLRRMRSQTLAVQLISVNNARLQSGHRHELAGGQSALAGLEVLGLRLAGSYSHRLSAASQVCATVAGVSYETLSGFKSRINYLQAVNSISTTLHTPVFVKIENVPAGAPLGRMAEIISMLKISNARVLVEFSACPIPEIDLRLGAAGIGIKLSSARSSEKARGDIRELVAKASRSRLFSFVDGIDCPGLVEASLRGGANLGAGTAISPTVHDPIAEIPSFPLLRASGVASVPVK